MSGGSLAIIGAFNVFTEFCQHHYRGYCHSHQRHRHFPGDDPNGKEYQCGEPGRTLSFAIGMVVDNSIVVFENIFRHREMGKTRIQAAYDGTVEVWGAVLASTLTTVAVFLPIVFVQEEAGQLFRDIAIAISSAVTLSLIVSITVIPTLSAKILGKVKKEKDPTIKTKGILRLSGGLSILS